METRTPILDGFVPVPALEERWNPNKERTFLGLLFGLGFWAVVAFNWEVLRTNAFWTLLLLLLADRTTCLLHECGHALAAILLRKRLILFRAGPVSMVRWKQRLRVTFEWRKFFMGGAVAATPPPGGTRRWQLVVTYASGPLANLITVLFLVTEWRAWLRLAPRCLLPLAFVSVLSLLLALIPNELGGVFSDGARLLLLADRRHAQTFCALIDLLDRMYQGAPPSTWEPELVELAAADGRYKQDRFAGNLLAYRWSRARGDFDRAALYMESALSICAVMNAAARADLFRNASSLQLARRNTAAALAWTKSANNPAPIGKPGLVPSVLLSLRDRNGQY